MSSNYTDFGNFAAAAGMPPPAPKTGLILGPNTWAPIAGLGGATNPGATLLAALQSGAPAAGMPSPAIDYNAGASLLAALQQGPRPGAVTGDRGGVSPVVAKKLPPIPKLLASNMPTGGPKGVPKRMPGPLQGLGGGPPFQFDTESIMRCFVSAGGGDDAHPG